MTPGSDAFVARDGRVLRVREDFFADPAARDAYVALISEVFAVDVAGRERLGGRDPTCRAFALFDANGLCAASAEVFVLPLFASGAPSQAAAIRLVAVHPAWRGLGLFRLVMERALAWCDAAVAGPALLYAAEPALYERFGFATVPQHKLVGAPPAPSSTPPPAARLSLGNAEHLTLVRRLLENRTPVSDAVAVRGGAALFLANATAEPDIELTYFAASDVLAAFRRHSGRLTLLYVVATTIPPLQAILPEPRGELGRIEVLFPADRLQWVGTARRDDTGLMIRGAAPAAFAQPFMLPPTTGF